METVNVTELHHNLKSHMTLGFNNACPLLQKPDSFFQPLSFHSQLPRGPLPHLARGAASDSQRPSGRGYSPRQSSHLSPRCRFQSELFVSPKSGLFCAVRVCHHYPPSTTDSQTVYLPLPISSVSKILLILSLKCVFHSRILSIPVALAWVSSPY